MSFDIREYCTANLSGVKISSGGTEANAECPFCGKPGRFYINMETGAWICFKCEERGKSVAGVIAQLEGISYSEARGMMMRAGITFRRRETTTTLLDKIRDLRPDLERAEHVEPEPVDFGLPPEFIPVWNGKKFKMPLYLVERGIKRETAKAWSMGFCNRGRYANRVIIPVECPNGRSITARSTDGDEPRYLNPKDADHARLILGWNMVRYGADFALVEGPLDAVKMWQHGIPAMALMGKRLHADQLSMLRRWPSDAAVVVMLDPEEAKAPWETAKALAFHFASVYIATLPDGVDPGASTKVQAHAAYDAACRYNGERGALAALVRNARKKMGGIYQ